MKRKKGTTSEIYKKLHCPHCFERCLCLKQKDMQNNSTTDYIAKIVVFFHLEIYVSILEILLHCSQQCNVSANSQSRHIACD